MIFTSRDVKQILEGPRISYEIDKTHQLYGKLENLIDYFRRKLVRNVNSIPEFPKLVDIVEFPRPEW